MELPKEIDCSGNKRSDLLNKCVGYQNRFADFGDNKRNFHLKKKSKIALFILLAFFRQCLLISIEKMLE